MFPKEIWKPIPGYPWYEVSNLGRIKSLSRPSTYIKNGVEITRIYKEKILQAKDNGQGYVPVTLTHEIKPNKQALVHRIVARVFLGKPPKNKRHVMHLDDVRHNNAATNLRWGSNKDNVDDKVAKCRQALGETNGHATLTESGVLRIKKLLDAGRSQKAVAAKFGVNQSTISDIKNGVLWSHVTGVPKQPQRKYRGA
jgi:hypothetical protein